MKKLIAATVIATLAFSFSNDLASADIIKTCSIKQANIVKSGKVCKKIGVLYRWVPTPTQQVIATPKPSTTIQPSTKEDFSVILSSFENVNKNLTKNNYQIPLGNIYFGPSLDPVVVKNSQQVLSNISNLFSSFYSPEYYYSVVGSELDVQWSAPLLKKINANSNGFNGCNNGNGGNEWSSYSCIYSNNKSYEALEIIAHEYTHSVLYTTGGNKLGRVSNYQRAFDFPAWMNEGAATYFGWWAVSQGTPDVTKHISNHLKGFSCMVKDYGNITSEAKLVEEMSAVEFGNVGVTNNSFKQYGYGAISISVLIAKHGGFEKLLDFYTAMRYTSNWEDAFQKTYGISSKEFYKTEYSDFIKMLPALQKGC
jgi:hypothetical protein